jgi:hypothetical protein
MGENSQKPTVVRTERGLTVHGTRLTLYLLMDYIKGGWTAEQIKACHQLTDQEYDDIVTYIADHAEEFEAEYQLVLKQAEEIRAYWEERNREHYARIAKLPPRPETAAFQAKLREHRAQYDVE